VLTKRKLCESGADRVDNYLYCFERVFGEKRISRSLWPLISPADSETFLLLKCVQEEKNGNNPHTGDCAKKEFQNMSSTSPATSELAENVYF
jgi:hypothetical protein